MAIATKIDDIDDAGQPIAEAYSDGDRLYLFFRIQLDSDLPPLPEDILITDGLGLNRVVSLDLQFTDRGSLINLFLQRPLLNVEEIIVGYQPTQWLMWSPDSGESVESFRGEIFPKSADLLDPALRVKSKPDVKPIMTSADIHPAIRHADEFRIQLRFDCQLDTHIPLDVNDFRAELDDRWLKILVARFTRPDAYATSDVELELSEPMVSGKQVTVGYRSPDERLKTIEGTAIPAFTVNAISEELPLGEKVSDIGGQKPVSNSYHQTSTEEFYPGNQLDVELRDGLTLDAEGPTNDEDMLQNLDVITRELQIEQGEQEENAAHAENLDRSEATTSNGSAAEIQAFGATENLQEHQLEDPSEEQTHDAKSRGLQGGAALPLPDEERLVFPPRRKLSLATKIIYFIPVLILVWLLFVVGIYIAAIVFDIDFNKRSDVKTRPVASIQNPDREPCSFRSADGSNYKGECVKGQRDGFGVYRWASGNRYEGQWLNGKRHGQGKLIFATGAVYEGQYQRDKEHGHGTMSWPNGAFYEGEYKNGRFHGQGKYRDAEGNRFEGIFENGGMTADGTCTKKKGQQYPGPCQPGQ